MLDGVSLDQLRTFIAAADEGSFSAGGRLDVFKARANGLADGLEPELSVVVDAVFPLGHLTAAVAAFQANFPATPLRLYAVETRI